MDKTMAEYWTGEKTNIGQDNTVMMDRRAAEYWTGGWKNG
jgi:hypothetical protein